MLKPGEIKLNATTHLSSNIPPQAEIHDDHDRSKEKLRSIANVLLEYGGNSFVDLEQQLRQILDKHVLDLQSNTVQLIDAQDRIKKLYHEVSSSRQELENCRKEREKISLSIGRTEARLKALVRRRDRLREELKLSWMRVREGDTTSRLTELEDENSQLHKRLTDLEQYLRETRGSSGYLYL